MDRFRGAGRLVAIVAAVVLAGVAAAALYVFIRGIEQRAFRDAELVEVFVAQDTIPEGASGAAAAEAALIDRDQLPRVSVPEDAITTIDQIAELFAESPIYVGEVIRESRFASSAEVEQTLEIPDGFEALTVQVGVPQGVAGFVRPGDRVSLIATLSSPGDDEEEPETQVSQYVLQDIEVLSTGQRVGDGADGVEEGSGQVLLTVALEPEDAETLVFAINETSLYFTLLAEDAEPAETPGQTLDDFLP